VRPTLRHCLPQADLYPGQSVIRVPVTVELGGRGMLAGRQLNDADDHDEGRGGENDADVGELVANAGVGVVGRGQ
jgi:hypothetical protein